MPSIKTFNPTTEHMGKGLKRDIWVLAGCWATVLTASTLITSASPLAAVSIGINRSVAPFTIGMFLIGAALISAYSAQIFTALGRAKGFGFGCALGLAGGVLGAIAMEVRAAWLIFIACFLIGTSQGLGQFYRFAATEICDEDERAPAVALVLSGGILAAFAGPEAAVGAQSFPWLGLMEHLLHERHGLTDSLLRKEGRTAGPGHQRPRHLRRRGRGVAGVGLRVYGDRLGRARLRRLRPDGPGRRHPRGQLPRRVAARRRPRGVEERLPQLYDLANDGRLSRAGGHGGAVGEERVVDVCVSVIYVRCRTYSGGDSGRDRGSAWYRG